MKSALMVMYSCVALHCHWQMLRTHVDTPITAKIIHHYTSSSQVTPGATDPPSCLGDALLEPCWRSHPASLWVGVRPGAGCRQPTWSHVGESDLAPSVWEAHWPGCQCCSLLQQEMLG